MDKTSPLSRSYIVEDILSYLSLDDIKRVQHVNSHWQMMAQPHTMGTVKGTLYQVSAALDRVQSANACHLVRDVSIDLTYSDLYSNPSDYERRVERIIDKFGPCMRGIKKLSIVYDIAHQASPATTLACTSAFNRLLRTFRNVQSLDLSHCNISIVNGERHAFNYMNQLRSIDWFKMGTNDRTSTRLLSTLIETNAHHLRVLRSKGDTLDEHLHILTTKQPSNGILEVFDAHGSRITDKGLSEIVNSNPSLRHIDISCCSRITSLGIASIQPKVLPNLIYLSLYGLQVQMSDYAQVFNSNNYWAHLKTISLRSMARLNDDSLAPRGNDSILEAIGFNCPSLLDLNVLDCRGVSDTGLRAVLSQLQSLRSVVVLHNASERPIPAEEEDKVMSMLFEGSSGTVSPGSSMSASSSGSSPNLLPISSPIAQPQQQNRRHSFTNFTDFPPLPSNAPSSTTSPYCPDNNAIGSRSGYLNISYPAPTSQNSTDSAISSRSASPLSGGRSAGVGLSRNASTSQTQRRMFSYRALASGIKTKRLDKINLDMRYDINFATCLSNQLKSIVKISGSSITKNAKMMIQTQFPNCSIQVWKTERHHHI
ncbi:hypothetical protein H4219_003534 [Mycoemilia scoparia]|uniref:F-box domain-containing protein n=1 Tax=Mycoemilia scoparia TaxID=417184 RepID=A0A9W8DST8_9FUNG|nr:hypothetical protein H4219_003534 [Mycoemilia scoparia]